MGRSLLSWASPLEHKHMAAAQEPGRLRPTRFTPPPVPETTNDSLHFGSERERTPLELLPL